LRLAPAPKPSPDEDVLTLCRALLELAERGEVASVAVALHGPDGSTSTAIAYVDGINPSALIGAVETVKARVVKLALGEE